MGTKTGKAKALRVEPAAWKLGEIAPGRFRQTFTIENHLSRIIVPDIRFDCGCMRIIRKSRAIEPGETGEVALELDTKDLEGAFEKRCSIGAADLDASRTALAITGQVLEGARLACTPNFVDLGDVPVGAIARAYVRLTRGGNEPVGPCTIAAGNPALDVQFEPAEADRPADRQTRPESGPLARLRIDYAPQAYPETFYAQVSVQTQEGPRATCNVTVTGRSVGPLEVAPRHVLLGRLAPGGHVERTVQIAEPRGNPLDLTVNAPLLPDGLEAVARRVSASAWEVGVAGHVLGAPCEPIKGALSVTTDTAQPGALRIPVLGLIAEQQEKAIVSNSRVAQPPPAM